MTLEERMNSTLRVLGLDHWQAVWTPDKDNENHGETLIDDKVILVYDVDEKTAWQTFSHEVLEIKFRDVVRPHRLLCNALIEVIDMLAYSEKERLLDSLPRTLEILRARLRSPRTKM